MISTKFNNAILQGLGAIKDSNGYPTVYDFALDS